MFKICTIGCGRMSSNMHGPSCRRYVLENPDTELSACCDLNSARAENYRNTFGFKRFYMDIDEMLDTERPDAVCLVVPVALTAELSIKVIRKGYPVMMEKPPGLNHIECEAIAAAAARMEVPTQVAFNRRYAPVTQELKKRLLAFTPEEIQNLKYDFSRCGRINEDFSTTAIHAIDTVRFLAGADYRRVNFLYQELAGGIAANIYLYAEMESGATAQIMFSPAAGLESERCTINLFNHTHVAEMARNGHAGGRLEYYEKGQLRENTSYNALPPMEAAGFYGENKDFFDDIKAGISPSGSVADALQSVIIADCIRNRKKEYVKFKPKKEGAKKCLEKVIAAVAEQ